MQDIKTGKKFSLRPMLIYPDKYSSEENNIPPINLRVPCRDPSELFSADHISKTGPPRKKYGIDLGT